MKKYVIMAVCMMLGACVDSPYHLKVNNRMGRHHGESVYLRSNMRSNYAMQIRGVLSQKLGELGIKAATSPDVAEFIGIFDIETFYPQDNYGTETRVLSKTSAPIFGVSDEGNSWDSSGNDDMKVDTEKTCFTLKIGRKDTSDKEYDSSFCSVTTEEAEEMLPKILNIYGKYASYDAADIDVQCLSNAEGEVDCDPMVDRKKAFIHSLWINSDISDDF